MMEMEFNNKKIEMETIYFRDEQEFWTYQLWEYIKDKKFEKIEIKIHKNDYVDIYLK